MVIVFQILETLLIIFIGGIVLYLLFLSLSALRSSKEKILFANKYNKFAFIIPAHNEELSITRTIKSILQIDYPGELWDLFVIADNCTDKTAEISSELGANVLIRNNPTERGKGYALRWCTDILLKSQKNYDAIVIVDADSIVQPNILKVLNTYLQNGSQAIQVADLVEPQYDSWSSEVTRVGFTLYNYVRPLGRKNFKFTAGLKGNGMCLSTLLLKKIPWSSWSLNEDLEHGLILLLNGIVVDFAPETIVLAAMPRDHKKAESQRSRWERGRYPVIKNYTLKLLRKYLKTGSFVYFDALIELITPPIVNLFVLITFMIFINALLITSGIKELNIFLYVWLAIFMMGILHILIGLKAANADRTLYKAFFHIPKYVIWKIYLYINFTFKKFHNEWIRTSRETN